MENQETVSYTVYETAQARADRRFRSMLWVIVMLIVMLVGTNGAWLIYESQFEDSISVSQDVDTGSSPAYVNGTGSMAVYGESETDNNQNP